MLPDGEKQVFIFAFSLIVPRVASVGVVQPEVSKCLGYWSASPSSSMAAQGPVDSWSALNTPISPFQWGSFLQHLNSLRTLALSSEGQAPSRAGGP